MRGFNKKESGFTLIELLVVIAIIGLLASVILVSLEDARTKGKNSAKNQLVEEYIKAIELYRSTNDDEGYPNENTTTTYCLGESNDPTCLGPFAHDYNSSLNIKLSAFIPGPPEDNISIPFGTEDMKGIAYRCLTSSDFCKAYEIRWYLIGADQNCIKGLSGANLGTSATNCAWNSETELEI